MAAAYAECEQCMNFAYDEELDEYDCQVYLDEDELARYMSREYRACPYFRGGDEYTIVRKQM
ncbi:MAG: DUF6472 family protein [Lachnospiraceae bacterium]|nr:DUF6472 family protein [Lachnospiraceae bacterium]